MSIHVLIADDHPVFRSGVRNELAYYDDIQVTAEAEDGDQALRLTLELAPDILLLDIHMPGMKAVRLLRALSEKAVKTQAIILTAYGDPDNVVGMLTAGARGYLLKDSDPKDIIAAIRAVAQGKVWLSPDVAGIFVGSMTEKDVAADVLSPREEDVLRLLALGYSNSRIADVMKISEGTVKNHVTSIYGKLNLHSRSEAVAWAWTHKLVKE